MDPASPVSPVFPTVPAIQSTGSSLKLPTLIIAGILIFTVGVGAGILAGKYIFPQPTLPIAPTPLPSVTSVQEGDPTANWKIFSSSQFGFSFKHPGFDACCGLAGAVVGNPASVVTLADKATVISNSDAPFDGIAIYAVSNGEGLSLDQYIEKEKLALYDQFKTMADLNQPHQGQVSETSIAGQRAIVLTNYSWDGITRTYFMHTNKKYIIEVSEIEKSPNHFSSYNQILSTFKFIDQSPESKDMYQGKYFSISQSTKWKFVSDVNQSPATPEVLETVAFTNNQANLNIQVGTNPVDEVLASQDGETTGKVTLNNVTFTKKSGYGGIADSVYSVSLVGSNNGKTYLVSYYTLDSQNIDNYNKDFDQILSTFRFVK